MKKEEICYYDSIHGYSFDEYKDYYKECMEEEDPTDEDVWDYISDCMASDFDDFKRAVERSQYNGPCVIDGSLGLWNESRHVNTVAVSLYDAVMLCMRACDYHKISACGGCIKIASVHHDGTNEFTIHLLNSKGLKALKRLKIGTGKADLGKKCYYKAIKELW